MIKTKTLFICGILVAAIIFEGAVRVISPLLGPPLVKWNIMEDAKVLKLEEFKIKHPRPKYILMGNSTVLIGFDPYVFDSSAALTSGSSFNAGMNGSEIRQIRDFACSYILKEIPPENLVILFSNPGMAMNMDYSRLTNSSNALENYSYLYRYRNTFRDPMTINTFIRILKFQNSRQGLVYRWADNLNESGYTKYGTIQSSITDLGWDPAQFSEQKNSNLPILDESGLRYLVEIRNLARAKGVNVILGTVPTLSYDPTYRAIIEKIAKHLGVDFVQGNDALGRGIYFQDGVHLNRNGATEFSKFLAVELLKLSP
jgi:hypothetical protein